MGTYRRLFGSVLVLLIAAALPGCNSCKPEALGATPPGSSVYTPVCTPRADGAYQSTPCNPIQKLGEQLGDVRCPLRGIGIPGLDCSSPASVEAPVAAAPEPQPTCDPNALPKDAGVGEVYCCVWVQPPAAAPVTVEVEPARAEWQRITCPPGEHSSDDCWALVTIPARMETRYSAPPPGFWQWEKNPCCKAPVIPSNPPCIPGK